MDLTQTIHLVGSIPLSNSAEVFDTICGAFGQHLRRLPDGETGIRTGWISFQHDMLEQHPAVMLDPDGRTVPIRDLQGGVSRQNHLFVLREGVSAENTTFLPLGYATAAIDSYTVFAAKQAAGVIPSDVRFQVSIPTPFATGLLYFHPNSQDTYIHLMKAALLAEVAQICAAIPHDKLAIQWDCCQEVLLAEGYFPADWHFDVNTLPPTLGELGDAVPAAVELGYHLCYGSPVDAPLVKQNDMGVVVQFANNISRALTRSLDFIHLPVSDPTADDTFFAPLSTLQLHTEVYLGLINPRDAQNDQKRIAAARRFLPVFGLSTECGWGRKQTEQITPLLNEHQAILANAA